ncbi:MAG TPA: hypothetical protein VMU04_13425, partial [Candidatus Acidoferrum sp.]|nr:hypothetical protein [Candidatus Acidoferrum sp.]
MNTSKALSLLIAALFTTAAQAQTMVSRWSNATWTSAKRGLAANPTTGNLLLVQGGTPGTIKRIKTADGTSAGSDMTYPTGGAGTYWVGGIAVASDGTIYGCNYAGSGTQYLYKWTNESATPTTLWTGSYNSGATAGEAGSVGANLAVYGTGNNAVFILASTTTGGLIIYNSGGTWTARAITVVNQSCTSGLTFIDYGVAGATLYRFVAKTGQTAGEIYTFDPTSGTGAITPGSTAMTGTFVYAANGIHGCAYDPITGLMATVTRVSSTSPYPVTNLLFNTGLVVGSGTLGNPAFLDRQNLLEGGTDSGSPGGVAWYQGAFFTSAANTLGTANLWAYDVTAFKVKDTTPAGPVTVCPGSSQSFNIVSGGSQLQYQWKVNKGSGYVNVSGSEYSGATTATLTINPASASDAGTYECIVSQPFTGGTTWTSTGAALIVSTPPAAFNVTGGGAYCAGGSGVSIGIDGSETGKHYQVWRNNSGTPGAVGSSIAGTGSAITTLATATVADTYSVVATDDTTSCTNTMTGSVTVTVNPLPTAYNVTGGGAYCSGGDGVAVGLANSELGKNYQLYRNGGATAVGSPVPGTGSAISFGNQTTADTYTVVATDALTLCTAAMSGNATVTVNPKPTADAGPGQTVCIGCGTAIGGSPTASGGSGSDYTYSWTPASGLSSATVANPTATPTSTTTYTVTVTDGNGCSADSSVTVTVNNVAPSISAQPANTTVCSGSAANFSVTASGSSLSYSWAQNNNGGWGNAWTVSGNGSTWLGTSAANDQGNPECTSFSAAGDINSPGGNALGMWGGFDGSEVAIRTFPSLT